MKVIRGLPNRDARPGEVVGIDIEMYKQVEPLHLPTGTFACVSVCLGDDVFVVEGIRDAREALKRARKGRWALFNAAYDLRHLRRYMDVPQREIWDVYLADRHLYTGLYQSTFSLKDSARRHLNMYIAKDTREEFAVRDTMTAEMVRYAALDAWVTARIAEIQMGMRDVDWTSFKTVSMPAIWPFLAIRPFRVDPDAFLALSRRLSRKGKRIQKELGINVNSHIQVKQFLLEHAGLKRLRNTRRLTLERYGGNPFNPNDGKNPLVKKVMLARSLLKMGSTYGESFLVTMDGDGYILPGWMQDRADTGRPACSDPNAQNIPIRNFPEYRNTIIASPGNVISAYDASAQEPRVGAQLTQDKNLLKLFRRGGNIYINVFAELRGIKIKKGSLMYRRTKDVTLGTFYGLTPEGLAQREDIPVDEAREIQSEFFEMFNAVPTWMGRMRTMAMNEGYVTTPLGRRLGVNPHTDQWPNQSVNFPVQGGAAEMTKLAMAGLLEGCQAKDLEFRLTLQVHDELVMDIPRGLRKRYDGVFTDAWMEAAKVVIPDVPMEIEGGYGPSWGQAK